MRAEDVMRLPRPSVSLQVFGANPDRVVDGFSEEFEEGFMDHLRRA
jgi:hypothetical protein